MSKSEKFFGKQSPFKWLLEKSIEIKIRFQLITNQQVSFDGKKNRIIKSVVKPP